MTQAIMQAALRASARHPGPWFRCLGPNAAARRRLVCFHHAGGGPSLFREWHRHCPPDTEVWAVATPGRETRFAEPPFEQLTELTNALTAVLPLDLPFAFFGHSLGGVVGFDLARQLHERGLPTPRRLFVSACPAPQLCFRQRSRAMLGDDELLRMLGDLGGTPKLILEHPDYRRMVLSALRADLALIDGYRVPESCDVRFPITIYAGSRDAHMPPDRMLAWERWALPGFACRRFEGDHFYLGAHRAALIEDLLGRWDASMLTEAANAHA